MAADEPLRARPAASGHRECFGGPLSEAPAFFILFCICLSLYLDTFIHSSPAAAGGGGVKVGELRARQVQKRIKKAGASERGPPTHS
ncbi:MAG: hypothetical protein LIO38_02020, partial [Cloacibacillus sp.]|nr:hypothetical protein [Cloacibacillus sp.]